jgi:hypothetical protein
MDKIELRKAEDLVPHPFNLKYFLDPSADPSFLAIRESIARDGIQEPLIIKADGTILSGNLRYAGFLWVQAEKFKNAKNSRELIKGSLIPVRVHADFESEADEVLYLIRSNLDRRQFTPERKAAIWDLWRSEYESVLKRKPGRPKADAPKIESPKEVAAQLGITVKTADALVVVKNSPLVPDGIRIKVFNNKIPATTVARAITFAEEEAAREQREPVRADVLRYLDNPPPKKFSETFQETISKPAPEKPVEKPAVVKPAVVKPAVVKKAAVVEVPPQPEPDPEPSFEDVLVQEVEETTVETPEPIAAPPDEPEPVEEPAMDTEPPPVEVEEEPVAEEPDLYDEADEAEALFDAGLDPLDPAGSGTPDPFRFPDPNYVDLHTEYPISMIKVDSSPEKKEALLKGPLAPVDAPEPTNVVQLKEVKDKIIAKYMMTQAGKEKLANALKISIEKSIDILVEKSHEQRIAIARSIIEALLGDITLNPDIKGNLVGLHSSLDTFLKDIGAIASVAPIEQNPYVTGLPTDIKGQLTLSRSFVSDITEVDDPVETRDLLLEIIQEAKSSVERLTNSKRTLEPNGLFCVDCLNPQFKTIHGDTCENGHGGAPGITEEQVQQRKSKQQAKSEPPKVDPVEEIDFDSIDLSDDPVPTSSDLNESDLDDLAASIMSSHPPAPESDPVVDILEEFSDELGSLV